MAGWAMKRLAPSRNFNHALVMPRRGDLRTTSKHSWLTRASPTSGLWDFDSTLIKTRAFQLAFQPRCCQPNRQEKVGAAVGCSEKNGIAIDTLRLKDTSLRDLYDKFLSINHRRITYQRFVDDNWFVIAAFEGDATVYVRANLVHFADQPDEIRGFSIWMSENRPDSYQSIAPAMLSSFRFNSDTRRDVGTPRIVAKDNSAKSRGGNSQPPELLVTPNTKPAAIGSCFNGLGDCPMSIFAFRGGH